MGFQPGIAIFADQASQTVYHHFLSLTQHMHTSIRHGIGLIYPTDIEQRIYTSHLLSEIDPGSADDQKRTFDRASADLSAVLTRLHTCLQSEEETEHYREHITLKQPFQLYIIGDTSAQTRELAASLRASQPATSEIEISYLFCCQPQLTPEKLFTGPDELTAWAAEQNIRFSYLYGDTTEEQQQAPVTEDVAYAAALALFTLLTTDLSVHLRMDQNDRDGAAATRQAPRCGTLSACLVSSPHEHIRQAYAAKVGGLLLENWQTEVIQARGRQEIQNAAIEAMKKTSLAWLLPSTAEDRSPTRREQVDDRSTSKGRTPLSQLAPEPATASLDTETRPGYESLYQACEEQTTSLLRLDLRQLEPARRRAESVSQTENWEAWRQAFAALWIYAQQTAYARITQAVSTLWETVGLSGVVTYATLLDEQLQRAQRRLSQTPAASAPPPQTPASNQEAGDTCAETPEQELTRQLDSQPGRLLPGLISLIMGILLSLASWMLVREFADPRDSHLLLLLPIALFCCAGMFAFQYIYVRHTYLVPLARARQKVQAGAREIWLKRCLLESHTQRLQLVQHCRTHLACLSGAFLQEITRKLHTQAREALEQPFAQSSSGRNFLCSKGRSLANAEQASSELLNPGRQVNTLLKNLSHEFIDSCKALFYQHFLQSGQPGGETSLQDALYHEIRSEIDLWFRAQQEHDARAPRSEQKQRSRTTYISSADFALNTKPEFFHQVLQRTQAPALWQAQAEGQATMFFCANPGIKKVRESANLPGPPVAIETIYAREKGTPFALTTNWILLAAFYCRRPAAMAETGQGQ